MCIILIFELILYMVFLVSMIFEKYFKFYIIKMILRYFYIKYAAGS